MKYLILLSFALTGCCNSSEKSSECSALTENLKYKMSATVNNGFYAHTRVTVLESFVERDYDSNCRKRGYKVITNDVYKRELQFYEWDLDIVTK